MYNNADQVHPSDASIKAAQFAEACRNLNNFMIWKAHELKRVLGFGYVESDWAPSTLAEIQQEFLACNREQRAYRVLKAHSENCVYTAEGNWAFRFWHDYLHHYHCLGMSTREELKVALLHANVVEREFGDDSTELNILLSDTAGQSTFKYKWGMFPNDQRTFVRKAVQTSTALAKRAGLCRTLNNPDAYNDARSYNATWRK